MSSNKNFNGFTKEQLYNLYVLQQLSTPQIGKLYNCSARCVQNYLKKFGINTRTFSQASILSTKNKSEETMKEYSRKCSERWFLKSDEERQRIIDSRRLSKETREKSVLVRKQNISKHGLKGGNKSKAEKQYYKYLISKFGEDDIICQYFDKERYPFNCDFYIKSLDLFIEFQGHYTHGKEPFDSTNKNHLKILEKKSKTCDMSTWTLRDVNKLNFAKQSNIKLLLVYYKQPNDFLLLNGTLMTL